MPRFTHIRAFVARIRADKRMIRKSVRRFSDKIMRK